MLYDNITDARFDVSGSVAVKLHLGEEKGGAPVPVKDVRAVLEKLESEGSRPFLFDTTVLYRSRRNTKDGYLEIARKNGYGEFSPVIAGDTPFIEKDGIKIPKRLADADSLLVLSHATGHILTGFAGALKNLGMGCVTREGKKDIHRHTQPRYDEKKCTSCGSCTEVCPKDLIFRGPEGKMVIDYEHCSGCRRCVLECPTGAMWHPEDGVEKSLEALAKAAKTVSTLFPESRIRYLNVMKRMTEFCDCSGTPGKVMCRDLGYITGRNPLGLDKKTAEMIIKENPKAFDTERWNLFLETAGKFFG